jgi:hypothetical protein
MISEMNVRSFANQLLTVRTRDSVIVLDSHGKRESSVPIPAALRGCRFGVVLLKDRSTIFVWPPTTERYFAKEDVEKARLTWVNPGSAIVRDVPLSLRDYGHYYDWGLLHPWRLAASCPAPVALATAATGMTPFVLRDEQADYMSGLACSWSEFWPATMVVCAVGGVAGWLCYRRQRRYGLPWTRTLVAFVFLCGLPGLLAYYVYRPWPAMERCPSCGRSVPRDRPACFACGQEFPTPAAKGIEVFA